MVWYCILCPILLWLLILDGGIAADWLTILISMARHCCFLLFSSCCHPKFCSRPHVLLLPWFVENQSGCSLIHYYFQNVDVFSSVMVPYRAVVLDMCPMSLHIKETVYSCLGCAHHISCYCSDNYGLRLEINQLVWCHSLEIVWRGLRVGVPERLQLLQYNVR